MAKKEVRIRVVEKSRMITIFGSRLPSLKGGTPYKFILVEEDIGIILDTSTGNIETIQLDEAKKITLSPSEEDRLLKLLTVKWSPNDNFLNRIMEFDELGIDDYESPDPVDTFSEDVEKLFSETKKRSNQLRIITNIIYFSLIILAILITGLIIYFNVV